MQQTVVGFKIDPSVFYLRHMIDYGLIMNHSAKT